MRRGTFLAAAASAAVLAFAFAAAAARPHGRSEYALLQMNLCLSGIAGCFAGTHYPAVVDEAIAKVRANRPNAVTLNEACAGDVDRIAADTGYHARFATVIYNGARLPCRDPADRGVFGIAVLTRALIQHAQQAPYDAQTGAERRRLLCVEGSDGVRACTSHLSESRTPNQKATNDAQCAELARVLASGAPHEPTILGGDMNRQTGCAPRGFWTDRDEDATQARRLQHVYANSSRFAHPHDEVLRMTYSDHDALLVHSQLHR
jgi:endonuclease/exonuclease/phosphatase family metal-dependent hydrolase